ncbi:MAG TPA: hypothetical protein VFZ72_01790 [Jiangellaceae bacterium]
MSTLVKAPTHLIRHLLGMCAAMCIGLAVLDAVFFGLARISRLCQSARRARELSTLVIAFNMALPMAI